MKYNSLTVYEAPFFVELLRVRDDLGMVMDEDEFVDAVDQTLHDRYPLDASGEWTRAEWLRGARMVA